MTPLPLEGRQGTKVDIDLCAGCRGFWFDQYKVFGSRQAPR